MEKLIRENDIVKRIDDWEKEKEEDKQRKLMAAKLSADIRAGKKLSPHRQKKGMPDLKKFTFHGPTTVQKNKHSDIENKLKQTFKQFVSTND